MPRDYIKINSHTNGGLNSLNSHSVDMYVLVDKISDSAVLSITDSSGNVYHNQSFPVFGSGFTQSNGFTKWSYGGRLPAAHEVTQPAPPGVVSKEDREAFFDTANAAFPSEVVSEINFGAGYGSFGPIGAYGVFSIRVLGEIKAPVTGRYYIGTIIDDGFIMTFDEFKYIDRWVFQAPTWTTTDRFGEEMYVDLEQGERYWFASDFFEQGGQRYYVLKWKLPGSTEFVNMPAHYTGIYRTMEWHRITVNNLPDQDTIKINLKISNNDGSVVKDVSKFLNNSDTTPPVIKGINMSLGFATDPFDESGLNLGDSIINADGSIITGQ